MNYRAWDVNPDDFYKEDIGVRRLAFLVKFAVLAPSSHNSQPWRFTIDNKKIILLPDFSRALPHSDANHRQLYISLGCALQNLLTAADYYGLAASVDYFPSDEDMVVVNFESINGEIANKDHLIFSILNRHTNRNKYLPRLPEDKFLVWLKGLSGGDFRIDLVENGDIKNRVADMVVGANIAAMDDSRFRSELSRYVKSNLTKTKTGMPMSGFGMPVALSFVAPWVVKYFNVNRMSEKDDERLLKEFTPLFVIISSTRDDRVSWVKSGQLFEMIALNAEKEGIRTAPMAAAIQMGNFYNDIQDALGTDFRPQIFFRIGYANQITTHSPRLLAEDVSVAQT